MVKPRVVVTRGPASPDAYMQVLAGAGAEPIAVMKGDTIPEFDALCLSGGPDVAPWRYGQDPAGSEQPDTDRDALELDVLLPRAWRERRPILAICRGVQILNVFRGGTLSQHIGEVHRAKGREVKPHAVMLDPASRLGDISGRKMVVNSRHHQVIERIAADLRATAWADAYIEGVEASEERWVVGVQWHPERTNEVDPAAVRIFDAFVRATERVPAR